MPITQFNNITPYERLFGSKPDYSYLRCFGCLCFTSTPKHNRSKLDPRADPCVFLGYPPATKGYKVLSLTTHKITVSRDVKFHEKNFPYHMARIPTVPITQFFLPTHTPYTHFSSFELPDVFHQNTQTFLDDSQNTGNTSPHPHINSPQSQTFLDASPAQDESPPRNVLRRSSRESHKPVHLKDYVCNLVSFDSLPKDHHALPVQTSSIKEPANYQEASTDPNWVQAMNKELAALESSNTWDIVDLPPGKKAIGSRWVFKTKLKADGSIERFKARLVAKGFNQKYGIDYEETFSPVVKMATVRSILSLTASKKWKVFQLDVNNAFLHGDLHEEVYMMMPEGLPNPHNKVCRLKKSIYGLKQASREWFAKLLQELKFQNFTQSKNDYSLFIKRVGSNITIAAVYVDDIIITGTDLVEINAFKAHLHHVFGIKDLGLLHFFLGFEVGYCTDGIMLTQAKFTRELITDSGITQYKHVATPLPLNLKLHVDTGELFEDPALYRALVGKLNFLTHTRPDLAYSVQTLSQFMHSPRIQHFDALQHVLHYVASTAGQGLILNGTNALTLKAYSDSDWAACPNTRRSISGYLLLLGNSPISWKSKKQSTVSKYSSEAEYRAMASAASEVTWLVRLLTELGIDKLTPITLYCDNQSAVHIARNPVFHERTKHIDIDCHFTRDKVMEGLIQLSYLPSQNQLADLFTKILPSPQFNELKSKLGMCLPLPSLRGDVKLSTTPVVSTTPAQHNPAQHNSLEASGYPPPSHSVTVNRNASCNYC